MATYLDLQNRIAEDLTRSDLVSQAKNAIQDAIKQYERERFWFNYTRSQTFNTVVGQTAYTGSDLAAIPNIIELDDLYIVRTISNVYPLRWIEPDRFEVVAGRTTANGVPDCYTRIDDQIIVYPKPTAVYTLRPLMHYRLTPLAGDTDSNAWCNEAENLIRAQAKLILYTNVLEDDAGAQRMMRQIPGIKAGLDAETSRRLASGRIRGTNF